MLKLIWTVAVMTAQGPAVQDIPYAHKFETKAECEQYGDDNKDRMGDWVRGVIRTPFDFPVSVVWRCEAEDRPA
jgi:hypothetical protein